MITLKGNQIGVLKVATVVSYCFIWMSGEHIGGPVGLFLALTLLSSSYVNIAASLIIIATLFLMVRSIFKPRKAADIYLFSIGGLLLAAPLIQQVIYISKYPHFINWSLFAFTSLLFLSIFSFTMVRQVALGRH